MFYQLIAGIGRLFLRLTRRFKMIGRKNVPKEGTYFFISNHLSNWDPFIISGATKQNLIFMAKESLFKTFLLGYFIRKLGARPINRDADPRDVLGEMVKILEEGHSTAMFPEGTRNQINNDLQPFKKGAAMIACKAQVPIVPIAIYGSNQGFFSKVVASYGKPFMPAEGSDRKALIETKEKMEREIGVLLEDLKAQYGKKKGGQNVSN